MIIETKFDKGEKAFIINRDRIMAFPVHSISYSNEAVVYSFVESKARTLMDKDTIIHRLEQNCFKSISELAESFSDQE